LDFLQDGFVKHDRFCFVCCDACSSFFIFGCSKLLGRYVSKTGFLETLVSFAGGLFRTAFHGFNHIFSQQVHSLDQLEAMLVKYIDNLMSAVTKTAAQQAIEAGMKCVAGPCTEESWNEFLSLLDEENVVYPYDDLKPILIPKQEGLAKKLTQKVKAIIGVVKYQLSARIAGSVPESSRPSDAEVSSWQLAAPSTLAADVSKDFDVTDLMATPASFFAPAGWIWLIGFSLK
jgi:hypothetical protein